jgi:leucyl-tRNA synthetase
MADRYEPKSFELKWQQRWKGANLFRTLEDEGRPKFYALDFFPYPSGAGLSVGHCRNYIPTDVLCRMKVMQGYNVLHPMGFDAFGLPAENEAIAKKTHPRPMVEKYAANYRRQMELIGISYDWSRTFSSCDPSYYKWTQWIFKLLFERGLAERRLAPVNWDPVEKTVLADEEVIGGRGWRSGALVERCYIPQWYLKITAYADRLLKDLDELDWPEGIKQQQRNWIGKSEGAEIEFPVYTEGEQKLSFTVFTTRIDTVFGVSFCVLAPEHPLVDQLMSMVDPEHVQAVQEYREQVKTESEQERLAVEREKTGVFTGCYALNPFNGEKVPIWIADYVLMTYGTGAVMAVPAHDERDYQFALKFGLPIPVVITPDGDPNRYEPYFEKEGIVVNSGEFSELSVPDAIEKMTTWVEQKGIGRRKVNYKMRDWLISRQRYWGCPIPIVYDENGNPEAVPDDALPVLLPDVEHYEPSGDGTSPLSKIASFVNVTTKEGRTLKRETDTMSGFACSSWYFLRFVDPHNDKQAWDKEKVQKWLPVDCYVGGAEHAVMHLLYARFWTKVLYDAGLVPFKEPFKKLLNQGLVLAQTPFRKPREGERLSIGEEGIQITFEEAQKLPADQVFYRWEKMSKSKGNVVTPDEAVEKYGADALRVFELFVAPFDQPVQWSEEGMQGAVRFLHRVFKLSSDLVKHYQQDWKDRIDKTPSTKISNNIRRFTHQTISKVTQDIERFALNTYIAALMIYVNNLNDALKSEEPFEEACKLALSEALETLILLLSPAAPHSADELWSLLGKEGFTYQCEWPTANPELAKEEKITIAVQVNGKLRTALDVTPTTPSSDLERMALENERVKQFVQGKSIRKVIVVPGKIVNIVAN